MSSVTRTVTCPFSVAMNVYILVYTSVWIQHQGVGVAHFDPGWAGLGGAEFVLPGNRAVSHPVSRRAASPQASLRAHELRRERVSPVLGRAHCRSFGVAIGFFRD